MHGIIGATDRDNKDKVKTLQPATPDHTTSRILVWDLATRLFHWSLVLAVSIAAVTGFLAPEWWLDVHRWAGYVIGFLIVFRLAWGFFGSYYARFKSFLFPVDETVSHLRGLVHRKPAHYTGHNPAGALMVFALLGVLLALTLSGIIILGGQENIGILAGYVSFSIGAGAVELHEILALALLAMIGAHVLGVIMESRLSRENLLRAMVTGVKNTACNGVDVAAAGLTKQFSLLPRAALIACAIILLGGGAAWSLMRTKPSGYIAMPVNQTYKRECGDCHFAYHPSLLPAASWVKIMASLDDHFEEDASLDDDTTKAIAKYLADYSSEKWDSEAANNLRHVDANNPMRITATPYWKRRHAAITKSQFAQKAVGSKGNCIACHKDAASGHFDDEKIAIPQPRPGQAVATATNH